MAGAWGQLSDDDVPFDLDTYPSAAEIAGPPPDPVTPEMAKQSIDDLVADALRYRSSTAYADLLTFMGRFRRYSPFNALLVHAQLEGAAFVAPANRWAAKYGRRVKPGERPIVVLQPFGPVMFVFDVSQTEPEPGAPELPDGFANPFAMPPIVGVEPALGWAVENAKVDGVRVHMVPGGSLSAGCIRPARSAGMQSVMVRRRPPVYREVPVRFETEVNRSFTATERYATLAHELAHLYCGHLGSCDSDPWPDRGRVSREVEEFEAESAAFIACQRVDDTARMPPHLGQYLAGQSEVPAGISLERVAAAAGQVVEMSAGWINPRKRKR